MSTATATNGAPPAKGKKKLIVILVAVLALVLIGGGVAAMLLLNKPADEYDDDEFGDDDRPRAEATAPRAAPIFVPLDVFTVNLADRDAERFAQIGITLEITDSKVGDQIKTYMPAIRNNVLMAIADRTATELVTREGKEALAERVRRETSRALGVNAPEPPGAGEDTANPRQRRREVELPVRAVHFSNFIVQ
jgi:flagellar protein FliL